MTCHSKAGTLERRSTVTRDTSVRLFLKPGPTPNHAKIDDDLKRVGDLVVNLSEAAQSVLRQDDWLDALKNQIVLELLTFMLGDPQTIEPGVDLILMSRHLERVG